MSSLHEVSMSMRLQLKHEVLIACNPEAILRISDHGIIIRLSTFAVSAGGDVTLRATACKRTIMFPPSA